MSTNNTENIGFKVTTMGREEVDLRNPCNLQPITLKKLFNWIDSKTIDVRLKIELKKSASSYPQQALGAWVKMYSRHLATAQKSLQKQKSNLKKVELVEEQKMDKYQENNIIANEQNDIVANEENNIIANEEFDFGPN